MISVQMEQRVNLKFLVKLGKNFTENYAVLKEVYENECSSCTQVFKWFQRFKEGLGSLDRWDHRIIGGRGSKMEGRRERGEREEEEEEEKGEEKGERVTERERERNEGDESGGGGRGGEEVGSERASERERGGERERLREFH
ncbi:hypothetical protein NQ318_000591 [Aromia moschata]|uniref:Mos1 transposase HTH domain-containing protein n=1 Tax=Aromia moschata TaxID=1265417 RepID=A0AAV8XQI3_9CUCU|nr:hypothetical protein NQ318_000591 [Aromia moschata]